MSTQQERKTVIGKLVTREILGILLKDRTTGGNVIWATDAYNLKGIGYSFDSPILTDGLDGRVLKKAILPRAGAGDPADPVRKDDAATPAWALNRQNNLTDRAWFGKRGGRFNVEKDGCWETDYKKIFFPHKPGRSWRDYVRARHLARGCGEALALASRFDPSCGRWIPVKNRIGLLDRKLRVIGENVGKSADWIRWAKEAVKSIYGFEREGNSVFLARQNLLFAVIESYYEKFRKTPSPRSVRIIAEILSWNVWQMDGDACVIPGSCRAAGADPFSKAPPPPCPGCASGDRRRHVGVYSLVMDWESKAPVRFVDLPERDPVPGRS